MAQLRLVRPQSACRVDSTFLSVDVLGPGGAAKPSRHHRLVGVAPHSLQHHRWLGRRMQSRVVLRFHHTLRRTRAGRGRRGADCHNPCAVLDQRLLYGRLVRGDCQPVYSQREGRASWTASPEARPGLFATRGALTVSVLGILLATAVHAHHPPHPKGLTNRWSQPLAVVKSTFDFMKQSLEFATLAIASGGSAPSR